MPSSCRFLAALIAQELACSAVGVGLHANPIRKVVNLLDAMGKKIEAEGETEKKLFEKFECYCKTGTDSLQASIASAEARIPELESEIGEAKGELEQLKSSVEQQKKDRTAAKNDASRATSLRENEAAQYAKESADLKSNIASMTKALAALRKGTSESFLQTPVAERLRKLIQNIDVDVSDREILASFLQGNAKTSAEYAPQSGEIIGILDQLKETMEGELADATASEKAAIESFQGLLGAKKKEIEALVTSLEEKMTRIGDSSVSLVNKEEDLKDTSEALASDQSFFAELKRNCGSKEAEWEERKKLRSDEILAIHETIKLLNDDDALDLFKKTLPSASFLQLQQTSKRTREQSRAALGRAHPHRDVRIDFISLALKGKQIGFEKVTAMIDEMAALLTKEASSDETKKRYCEKEIDGTEDELKELKRKSSDLGTAIVECEHDVAALTEEIKTQEASLKALDEQVRDATQQRKDEHADFVETLAANNAAIQLLGLAKNRLLKFYNKATAQKEKQRTLADDDQIVVNFGGSAPPTPAPGGIANTGITGEASAFVQIASSQSADPTDAPQTWSGKLKKKESESQGVTQMIDLLVQDLSNEVTIMETEEKEAQADYEKLMKSSAAKRAIDVKVLTEKEGAKADGEATLQKYGEDARVSEKAVASTVDSLGSLHQDCDWLLQNFGIRREARSGEIESLKRARAVLAGADYSLLQMSSLQKRSNTRTRFSLGQRQVRSSPEETLATEMTHDLEMNFNKIAPFGKEDTAKELQDHAAKTQNTLVDAVENAEVAEIKRAVFRALTRLRAATIKEFDTIARLETQAIDAYNDAHHYRAENPLAHLHEDEAPVETDKLKSFH